VKILALETSTEYCSIALWQDGEVTSTSVNVGQKHSEVIIEMLDGLMSASGTLLGQLDGIAFGAGPGSFTGVRIACGVAQGLALGTDLPVVGISTLLALAENSGKNKVITALDARMAEVYFAAYEKNNGQWLTVSEPCLCLPTNAIAVKGDGWFGAGSGFAAHGDVLQACYMGQLEEVDATCVPQARAIAVLAAPIFFAGKGQDAAQAMPIYLRDKVAFKSSERMGSKSS